MHTCTDAHTHTPYTQIHIYIYIYIYHTLTSEQFFTCTIFCLICGRCTLLITFVFLFLPSVLLLLLFFLAYSPLFEIFVINFWIFCRLNRLRGWEVGGALDTLFTILCFLFNLNQIVRKNTSDCPASNDDNIFG